eukprot:TRINITY_DN38598_c0_g1_i2.p1 TRINITY_DN38598_c0_g1~~TRINITY_DN38598_c0_g1_i2.p1  ORF type:complete len:512 (+),score=86.26 TRINITY_DN38598_c0_g1_i2:50-1585(+)
MTAFLVSRRALCAGAMHRGGRPCGGHPCRGGNWLMSTYISTSTRQASLGSLGAGSASDAARLMSASTRRSVASSPATSAAGEAFAAEVPGASLSQPLRVVNDAELEGKEGLIATGGFVVLHCGVAWVAQSRAIADRLRDWSTSHAGKVTCVTADVSDVPELLKVRNITSLPAVLFFRRGKLEARSDGANLVDLERILEEARMMLSLVAGEAVPAGVPPGMLLKVVDEIERRNGSPDTTSALCRQALDSSPALFTFRARLGILRSALRAAEASSMQNPPEEVARDVANTLEELHRLHERELDAARQDGEELHKLMAHAGLLTDAWAHAGVLKSWPGACVVSDETDVPVLRLYSAGKQEEALKEAMKNYHRKADGDMAGLIAAYCQPDRGQPDEWREAYGPGLYSVERFATDTRMGPGPVAERSMLVRLFTALGPMHPVVLKSRADLEFLLDLKKHVPFHTKTVYLRKGGQPRMGRGSGKKSGYSKGYWLSWGPHRYRINQKKMNGPWNDKND